eukprot:gene4441-6281_t
MSDEPLVQGYLQIVSNNISQRLFVVAKNDKISCYNEDPSISKFSNIPIYSINLKDCVFSEEGSKKPKTFALKLSHNNFFIDFDFTCPTNSLKQQWVSVVSERIGLSKQNFVQPPQPMALMHDLSSINASSPSAVILSPKQFRVKSSPLRVAITGGAADNNAVKIRSKSANNISNNNLTSRVNNPRWVPGNFGNKPHSSRILVPNTDESNNSSNKISSNHSVLGNNSNINSINSNSNRNADLNQYNNSISSNQNHNSNSNSNSNNIGNNKKINSENNAYNSLDNITMGELRAVLQSIPLNIREALVQSNPSPTSSHNFNYSNQSPNQAYNHNSHDNYSQNDTINQGQSNLKNDEVKSSNNYTNFRSKSQPKPHSNNNSKPRYLESTASRRSSLIANNNNANNHSNTNDSNVVHFATLSTLSSSQSTSHISPSLRATNSSTYNELVKQSFGSINNHKDKDQHGNSKRNFKYDNNSENDLYDRGYNSQQVQQHYYADESSNVEESDDNNYSNDHGLADSPSQASDPMQSKKLIQKKSVKLSKSTPNQDVRKNEKLIRKAKTDTNLSKPKSNQNRINNDSNNVNNKHKNDEKDRLRSYSTGNIDQKVGERYRKIRRYASDQEDSNDNVEKGTRGRAVKGSEIVLNKNTNNNNNNYNNNIKLKYRSFNSSMEKDDSNNQYNRSFGFSSGEIFSTANHVDHARENKDSRDGRVRKIGVDFRQGPNNIDHQKNDNHWDVNDSDSSEDTTEGGYGTNSSSSPVHQNRKNGNYDSRRPSKSPIRSDAKAKSNSPMNVFDFLSSRSTSRSNTARFSPNNSNGVNANNDNNKNNNNSANPYGKDFMNHKSKRISSALARRIDESYRSPPAEMNPNNNNSTNRNNNISNNNGSNNNNNGNSGGNQSKERKSNENKQSNHQSQSPSMRLALSKLFVSSNNANNNHSNQIAIAISHPSHRSANILSSLSSSPKNEQSFQNQSPFFKNKSLGFTSTPVFKANTHTHDITINKSPFSKHKNHDPSAQYYFHRSPSNDSNITQMTDIAEWHRLTDWLARIGLHKYNQTLKNNNITKLSLVELLENNDMIEMNIDERDIPTFLTHISELSAKTQSLSKQAMSNQDNNKTNNSSKSPIKFQVLNNQKKVTTENNSPISSNQVSPTKMKLSYSPIKSQFESPAGNNNPIIKSSPNTTFHKILKNKSQIRSVLLRSFMSGDTDRFFSAWKQAILLISSDSNYYDNNKIHNSPLKQIRPAFNNAKQAIEFHLHLHFAIYPLTHFPHDRTKAKTEKEKLKHYLESLTIIEENGRSGNHFSDTEENYGSNTGTDSNAKKMSSNNSQEVAFSAKIDAMNSPLACLSPNQTFPVIPFIASKEFAIFAGLAMFDVKEEVLKDKDSFHDVDNNIGNGHGDYSDARQAHTDNIVAQHSYGDSTLPISITITDSNLPHDNNIILSPIIRSNPNDSYVPSSPLLMNVTCLITGMIDDHDLKVVSNEPSLCDNVDNDNVVNKAPPQISSMFGPRRETKSKKKSNTIISSNNNNINVIYNNNINHNFNDINVNNNNDDDGVVNDQPISLLDGENNIIKNHIKSNTNALSINTNNQNDNNIRFNDADIAYNNDNNDNYGQYEYDDNSSRSNVSPLTESPTASLGNRSRTWSAEKRPSLTNNMKLNSPADDYYDINNDDFKSPVVNHMSSTYPQSNITHNNDNLIDKIKYSATFPIVDNDNNKMISNLKNDKLNKINNLNDLLNVKESKLTQPQIPTSITAIKTSPSQMLSDPTDTKKALKPQKNTMQSQVDNYKKQLKQSQLLYSQNNILNNNNNINSNINISNSAAVAGIVINNVTTGGTTRKSPPLKVNSRRAVLTNANKMVDKIRSINPISQPNVIHSTAPSVSLSAISSPSPKSVRIDDKNLYHSEGNEETRSATEKNNKHKNDRNSEVMSPSQLEDEQKDAQNDNHNNEDEDDQENGSSLHNMKDSNHNEENIIVSVDKELAHGQNENEINDNPSGDNDERLGSQIVPTDLIPAESTPLLNSEPIIITREEATAEKQEGDNHINNHQGENCLSEKRDDHASHDVVVSINDDAVGPNTINVKNEQNITSEIDEVGLINTNENNGYVDGIIKFSPRGHQDRKVRTNMVPLSTPSASPGIKLKLNSKTSQQKLSSSGLRNRQGDINVGKQLMDPEEGNFSDHTASITDTM